MVNDGDNSQMRYHWLVDILDGCRHEVGVEIGVARGDTSWYVLENLPNLIRYYLIDPWTDEGTHEWHNKGRAQRGFASCMERLRPHMDRAVLLRKRSKEAIYDIPAGSADWCFIDGNHLPLDVRTDIKLAQLWVRPGGLICGHDWNCRKPTWDIQGPVLEQYSRDRVQLGPDGIWFVWKDNTHGE